MTICICGHDISKHSQQGCMTIIDNDADKYCSCELTRMDVIKACAEAAEAERDEARLELQHIRTMLDDGSDCDDTALDMVKRMHAQCYELRRQLTEAQSAIDVLSNTVVAQDATIKRLEQAREDVADYRAEIARLNQAMTA